MHVWTIVRNIQLVLCRKTVKYHASRMRIVPFNYLKYFQNFKGVLLIS